MLAVAQCDGHRSIVGDGYVRRLRRLGGADARVDLGASVSDGESLRIIRNIFEGLVTTEEGGTEIIPSLATEWRRVAVEWTTPSGRREALMRWLIDGTR